MAKEYQEEEPVSWRENLFMAALIGVLLLGWIAWAPVDASGADNFLKGTKTSGGGYIRREKKPPLSPARFVGQTARAYQIANEIPDILDQLSLLLLLLRQKSRPQKPALVLHRRSRRGLNQYLSRRGAGRVSNGQARLQRGADSIFHRPEIRPDVKEWHFRPHLFPLPQGEGEVREFHPLAEAAWETRAIECFSPSIDSVSFRRPPTS